MDYTIKVEGDQPECLSANDEIVDDDPRLVPVPVLHLDQHLLGLKN